MSHIKEELKNPPKNVASHLWEKFKALEKRTNDVTQRSTEKRIKHLQNKVLETVTKEFTTDEDKDILREHDVKFGPSIHSKPTDNDNDDEDDNNDKKWRKRKNSKRDTNESQTTTSCDVAGPAEQLKSYMGLNDHLVTTDHSRPGPPTALEQKLNDAVSRGEFEMAEAISDRLSERAAGERIVAAIEGKKYLEEKEKEKETYKSRKKRKLHWGFEPKERWETKGNM